MRAVARSGHARRRAGSCASTRARRSLRRSGPSDATPSLERMRRCGTVGIEPALMLRPYAADDWARVCEVLRFGQARRTSRDLLGRLEHPITLNVANANGTARALYERFGFGIEREFVGNFQGTPCESPSCAIHLSPEFERNGRCATSTLAVAFAAGRLFLRPIQSNTVS